jgi:hypothetical protein
MAASLDCAWTSSDSAAPHSRIPMTERERCLVFPLLSSVSSAVCAAPHLLCSRGAHLDVDDEFPELRGNGVSALHSWLPTRIGARTVSRSAQSETEPQSATCSLSDRSRAAAQAGVFSGSVTARRVYTGHGARAAAVLGDRKGG